MELVTQEIHNLKIDNSVNRSFIQDFSRLNLNTLKLDENDKILVGHVFFQMNLMNITDFEKQYFLSITNYFTEKKNTRLYPFSNKLILQPKKILNNPRKYWLKILKDNYSFTKVLLDKVKIYQVFIEDNIVIYLISLEGITKKIKELKKTETIHLYTNPNTGYNLEELYKQITTNSINNLNKKFYFFYQNIKITINEKQMLEEIV
tara:strand:- start:387 stop:1001 length:615 start_codon:yes stop_codon:yes gene_type:complete